MPLSTTTVSGVYIIAKDKIRLLFSTEVSESYELLKTATYSLNNVTNGIDNTIIEVLPLPDKATDYIDIKISNLKWGDDYTISIPSGLLSDIDGLLLGAQEISFVGHRTKVDTILTNLPNMYNVNQGNIRSILEAVAIADNDIGGSTTEESTEAGESLGGSGTYGTSTYGSDTYGG